MSEENIENNFVDVVKEVPENFDELQIFIHNSLQTIISQALDAKDYYDPFTVVGYIVEISKLYQKKLKKSYKEMVKDRKKFEEKLESERPKDFIAEECATFESEVEKSAKEVSEKIYKPFLDSSV